jgi:hypothetical protein
VSTFVSTCSGPSCDRVALAHGLCEGHRKQRQRGEPLTPLRPRAATASLAAADRLVQAAAIAFADCTLDLIPAAYQELLRAVAIRDRVLGQASVSQPTCEDVEP